MPLPENIIILFYWTAPFAGLFFCLSGWESNPFQCKAPVEPCPGPAGWARLLFDNRFPYGSHQNYLCFGRVLIKQGILPVRNLIERIFALWIGFRKAPRTQGSVYARHRKVRSLSVHQIGIGQSNNVFHVSPARWASKHILICATVFFSVASSGRLSSVK